MDAQLRRRCKAILRRLKLPEVVPDVQTLVDLVAMRRGRPIILVAFDSGGRGPTGAWVPTEHADYVFYERDTTALHQAAIILHEIGHMVLDHQPVPPPAATPLPVELVAAGAATKMLGRSDYLGSEEREAELIASLLLCRVVQPTDSDPLRVALARRSRR